MFISLTPQCSACQGSHCVAREHDKLGKPLLVWDIVLHWWKLKVSSSRRSRDPALQRTDFSCPPSFLHGYLAESHHWRHRPHPRYDSDPELWKNLLAPLCDSWICHLGTGPGQIWGPLWSFSRRTGRFILQAKYPGLIPEHMDSTFHAQCDLEQSTHTISELQFLHFYLSNKQLLKIYFGYLSWKRRVIKFSLFFFF